MAARCTICRSKHRAEVESELVAGTSLRDIARRFHLTKDSISRHSSKCVKAELAKRVEARDVALADRLLREIEQIHRVTRMITARAIRTKDLRTGLRGISEARRNLTFVARMVGRLDPVQEQDKRDGQMVTWEEFVVLYQKANAAA
jgi:DNA-binding MarR family transcriptional regulator